MRAYVSAARGAAAAKSLTDVAPPDDDAFDPDDPDSDPAPYTWGELQARIHVRLAEIQAEIDRGEGGEEAEDDADDAAAWIMPGDVPQTGSSSPPTADARPPGPSMRVL